MENGLLVVLSITTLLVMYWIIRGQKQYNDLFRDYFQPPLQEQKKEDKNKEKRRTP